MQNKRKGIYLVTEEGCLIPSSGAYRHIKVGYNQLCEYFDVRICLNSRFIQLTSYEQPDISRSDKKQFVPRSENPLKGFFKDIYLLLVNHRSLWRFWKQCRLYKPDFIYERAAYLDFKGLVVAKCLGIPHFYEANGIQHQIKEHYYASYFKSIAAFLEKWAYSKSSYVFFVGSYGHFFNLKTNNWKNIENGVELDFIKNNESIKKYQDGKINVAFIANLMKHQRSDLLVEALKKNNNKDGIRLHLIGGNLDIIQKELESYIEVVNHGFVERKNMEYVMQNMHVGIIAGSPEFQSAMKLFDYSCFKCVVIAPDVFNFNYWFTKDEIVFFQKENSQDLTEKLDNVLASYEQFADLGERLFEKTFNYFTWEHIYSDIQKTIAVHLN